MTDADIVALRDLAEECCGDTKCMDCVLRVQHDECYDDCPSCCADILPYSSPAMAVPRSEWERLCEVERCAREFSKTLHFQGSVFASDDSLFWRRALLAALGGSDGAE